MIVVHRRAHPEATAPCHHVNGSDVPREMCLIFFQHLEDRVRAMAHHLEHLPMVHHLERVPMVRHPEQVPMDLRPDHMACHVSLLLLELKHEY